RTAPQTQPNAQTTMRRLFHETGFGEVGGWREFTLLEAGLIATGVCAGGFADAAGGVGLPATASESGPANSPGKAALPAMGILRPGIWKKCSSGKTRPKQRMLRQRISRQRA